MANIRELSPELAAVARDELNEVKERIPEDINVLRTWIQQQPHLKARTDDQFLVTFLRGVKYSLEKAKQKINYFYTVKSLSPEMFLNKSVDDKVLRLVRLGTFAPLPKPLKPDGPRLHVTRFAAANHKEFSFIELLKVQLRMFDIEMMEDDNAMVAGVINIFDFKGMTMGHILQFEPSLLKKTTVFTEKGVPMRVKGLHLINVSKEVVTLINLCRSLMPKKTSDRMVAHSSMETLYKHVPKEYLPEDYGGSNGRIKDILDEWEKKLISYKTFFEEDRQYVTNEKLRPGPKFDAESVFGLDGSFRKLEVD